MNPRKPPRAMIRRSRRLTCSRGKKGLAPQKMTTARRMRDRVKPIGVIHPDNKSFVTGMLSPKKKILRERSGMSDSLAFNHWHSRFETTESVFVPATRDGAAGKSLTKGAMSLSRIDCPTGENGSVGHVGERSRAVHQRGFSTVMVGHGPNAAPSARSSAAAVGVTVRPQPGRGGRERPGATPVQRGLGPG